MTPQEIEALKAERDALAAQVEVQNDVIKYAHNKLYILSHNRNDVSARCIGDADKAFKVVDDYLSVKKTPQQCLRDAQAEAVMGFVAFVFAQYESGEYHVTAREKYRQLNSRPHGQTVSVHNDPEYCGVLGNAEKYAATVRQGGAE